MSNKEIKKYTIDEIMDTENIEFLNEFGAKVKVIDRSLHVFSDGDKKWTGCLMNKRWMTKYTKVEPEILETPVEFMDIINYYQDIECRVMLEEDDSNVIEYYLIDELIERLSWKYTVAKAIKEGKWFLKGKHDILKYPFQRATDKWISKDGKEIELVTMSRGYIANARNMIERICKEDNLDPKDYPIYKELVNEYNIRKIRSF